MFSLLLIKYLKILYKKKNHKAKFAKFFTKFHNCHKTASNQKTSQYTSELSTNFHANNNNGYNKTYITFLRKENEASHSVTFSVATLVCVCWTH
jgi:hypothetical protein